MREITFRTIGGGDVSIFAADGEKILDVARKANVAIDAPCSGNGSCGKCRVKILSGAVSADETRHITPSEYSSGWRLACGSEVCENALIEVPDIASAYRSRMKTADLSSPEEIAVFERIIKDLSSAGLSFGCGVSSFILSLGPPSLTDTMPDNERLIRSVSAKLGVSRNKVRLPFFCLKKLPGLMREGGFSLRVVAEKREDSLEVLDLLSPEDKLPVCGVAVDIGTTTVSALLADLENGRILSKASSGNGQIRFGADVINRIIEQSREGGTKKLLDAIVSETLLPLIDTMCRDAGVPKDRIYRVTAAGNTTMEHLLLGITAEHLRMEPYIPAFFTAEPFDPALIGIALSPSAGLRLAPNVGSYVGGDITAGTLASMIWNEDGPEMLIDLGTNGEIVFGGRDFLITCACSAGPAFEGSDISCGIRATDGAIEDCRIDSETMEPSFSVIGGEGTLPVGICGSGIIDIVAGLFRAGIIDGRGRFSREGGRIMRDEYGVGRYVLADAEESGSGREISINEVDIDNFIRAKGAVFSAMMTVITSLGYSPSAMERIFVAGGIGGGINIKNAVSVGMFPDIPENKYTYIGNSSLTGAYAALVSSSAAGMLEAVAAQMTYVELSTEPGYMDSFVAACFLPHTDASLFPSGGAL